MNTQIETITPRWAAEVLENKNTRNIRFQKTWAEKLARDIKAGTFLLTHQGIAFDAEGILLDGQHRLAAVVMANKPVQMLVTTGIACSQKANGGQMRTWNTIDQGRIRKAGDVLSMEGMSNGRRIAAVARCLLIACGNPKVGAVSLPQIQLVLEEVGEHIETCSAIAESKRQMFRPPASAIAATALLHTTMPMDAEEFMAELVAITGPENAPSRALIGWIKRHPMMGGANAIAHFKTTASALKAHTEGQTRIKLYSSEQAYSWLLSTNKPLVEKFKTILCL
jgi:hypothetical protein